MLQVNFSKMSLDLPSNDIPSVAEHHPRWRSPKEHLLGTKLENPFFCNLKGKVKNDIFLFLHDIDFVITKEGPALASHEMAQR